MTEHITEELTAEQRERVARVLLKFMPMTNRNLRRELSLEAADDAIAAIGDNR